MDGHLPEVSLINSWYEPTNRSDRLLALELALHERISLFDLYFLGGSEVAWYAKAAERAASTNEDVLSFAAGLRPDELRKIAKALRRTLTDEYKGNLVGLRPRFAALATHWPQISLPPDEDSDSGKKPKGLRFNSIKILRNSLYLGALLGCHHVEIVCGSCIPEHLGPYKQAPPKEYRRIRLETLANSLVQVFQADVDNPLFLSDRRQAIPVEKIPYLCVEIEPGASFLIKDIDTFVELKRRLESIGMLAWKKTLLNVDIAHMMLLEGLSKSPLEQIRESHLEDQIGHMHISDHSKTHACDLPPGSYHFFGEYKPWLELGIELCRNNPAFSKVIAVEMEACNSISDVLDSVATVRRWLKSADRAQSADQSPDLIESNPVGSLMVIDIGNSTQELLAGPCRDETGLVALEKAVEAISERVQRAGGSVMSFTGDGVIALFEDSQFLDSSHAALAAFETVDQIRTLLEKLQSKSVTFRASLHYGKVHIPTAGRLRSQIIGLDVVCAARVCQKLLILSVATIFKGKGQDFDQVNW